MVTLFNVPVKRMLAVALVVLIGCKDSDKNSSLIFEELNESLERSNKNLELSTIEAINRLESKKRELAMAEKANTWGSRANSVVENSKNIIAFIDSVQQLAVKENVDRKKYSEKLDSALKRYQASVLTSDLYERKGFDKRINFHPVNLNVGSDISRIKASLLKLKNDVRNMENMAVKFCNDQVGMLDGPGSGYYESYSAIAAANSTKLGANEEIIITAGVAQFSKICKPSFIINGKNIPPNEMGIGEYKMKVSSKAGKYKVPVKISFTTNYGKPALLEKDIEYTVVE